MNEFGNIFTAVAAAVYVPNSWISRKFLFLNNKTNHIATHTHTNTGGGERKMIKLDIIPLLFEYKI